MIVNYRTDSDGAIGVVDDIEAAGGTASSARADVTDPEAADALVTGILSLRGWIVYIGSTAPDYVGEGRLAHGTAKSALTTFARHLAAESGRDGVSVLVVAPGAVRTPATAGILAGDRGEVLARESVLGRFLEPEDVAAAVALAADPALRPATVTVLRVDGGWTVLVGGPAS